MSCTALRRDRSESTSVEIDVVSGPTPTPSSPPIAANSRATASAVSVVVPSRIMLPVRSASQTSSLGFVRRWRRSTTSRIVTFGTWPKGTIVTGMPFGSVKRFGRRDDEVLGRAGRRRLLFLLRAVRCGRRGEDAAPRRAVRID